MLFLLSSSSSDYADFVLQQSLGRDWPSYFDLCMFYARKPSFFQLDAQFYDSYYSVRAALSAPAKSSMPAWERDRSCVQTENRFPQRRVSQAHEYDPPEASCSLRPLDLDADSGRAFYAGGSSARLNAWLARQVAERRAARALGDGTRDTEQTEKATPNGDADANPSTESNANGVRVLYVGDSLRSDLAPPRVYTQWQLCAIIPELAFCTDRPPQIARDGLPLRHVDAFHLYIFVFNLYLIKDYTCLGDLFPFCLKCFDIRTKHVTHVNNLLVRRWSAPDANAFPVECARSPLFGDFFGESGAESSLWWALTKRHSHVAAASLDDLADGRVLFTE